jgi:uncharacterized repeat protein (TIGR03847 family)
MTPSFELDAPDYFTVGAVGPPGERVFYLQAREGGSVVTLKSEKEQVRTLAEYLAGVLSQLPGAPTPSISTELPLLEPIEPAWPVGSIGLGYDETDDRIVIVANAVKAEDAEGEEGEAASARFSVTRAQAAGFVERARALMKGGRPTCPMCSGPIDPGGHVCPRANGHIVARE